jgi:hypothetical protein
MNQKNKQPQRILWKRKSEKEWQKSSDHGNIPKHLRRMISKERSDFMVTGSIYERKGIYYAIVSYYVDGRRKQKSVSTGLPVKGNKRRALEFLENLKRTYETKESMENMDGSRLLMTDYMDEWLKIVKPLVERTTYKSYGNMVSARIRPHFEKLNLLLTEVEPKHIKMLYDEILE